MLAPPTLLRNLSIASRVQAGLVGYWRMQGEVLDSEKGFNGVNLARYNSQSTQSTGPGGSIPFARWVWTNDDFYSDDATLEIGDHDFSIAAWLSLASFRTGNGESRTAICRTYSPNNYCGPRMLYYHSTSGAAERMAWRAYTSGGVQVFSLDIADDVALNTWGFYWGTYRAATRVVSGGRNAFPPSFTQASGSDVPGENAGGLFAVGTRGPHTYDVAAWHGSFCGVGLWKRVLTWEEALWLYDQGRGRFAA